MTPNPHLEHLRARARRSLRSFLRRNSFTTHVHPSPRSAANPTAPSSSVDISLISEVPLLRDERLMRALAKEIKRLIAEDSRRGIA